MFEDIIKQSLPVFFGVLQSLFLVVISGAFKIYFDVRKLKQDLRSAFTKIRNLEAKIKENELRDTLLSRTMEPSKICDRKSER